MAGVGKKNSSVEPEDANGPSRFVDGHDMSQTSPRWSAAPPANKDTSTSNSFSNVRPISPWAASHYPFDRLPPILYCLGLPLKTTDLGIAKLPLPFVGYARSLVDRFPMIVPVTWEEVEANHRKPETRYLCMLYVDSIPGGVEETCMVMREPKLVYHFTEETMLLQIGYLLRPDAFGTVVNPFATALMNSEDMKPVAAKIFMAYYRAPKAELLTVVQPRAIEPGIIVSTMDHLPD